MNPSSLNLHKKLSQQVKKIINACQIKEGKIAVSNLKELAEIIQSYKSRWIDHFSIAFNIASHILCFIADERQYFDKQTGLLVHLIPEKQIEQIINSYLQYIEEIPKKYKIYISLPNVLQPDMEDFDFNDKLSIIKIPQEDIISSDDINDSSLSQKESAAACNAKIYICLKVEGYMEESLNFGALSQALICLKQFIYLGLLGNLFSINTGALENQSLWDLTLKQLVAVLTITEETNDLENKSGKIYLPYNMAMFLRNIDINGEMVSEINYLSTIDSNYQKKYWCDRKDIPFEKKMWLASKRIYLNKIKKIIGNDLLDGDASHIKRAARWACESMLAEDIESRFDHLCKALEAVLGEDTTGKSEGLVERLADRCAFMLGKGINDRNKIRKDFKKLYNERSRQFHGVKLGLGEKGLHALRWGRNIIKELIIREVSHMQMEHDT